MFQRVNKAEEKRKFFKEAYNALKNFGGVTKIGEHDWIDFDDVRIGKDIPELEQLILVADIINAFRNDKPSVSQEKFASLTGHGQDYL